MDHSQVFSDDFWRPLTMAFNLAVFLVITWLAARRTPDSVARWRAASATDLSVCATLLTSLLFVWLSTFLIFGLGTSRSLGCLILLRPFVLGTFIGIDLLLNSYYTSLFAVPLLRGQWKNPRLKRLAVKSALAAVLTVSSSVVNLGIYASHHGSELSWVCLSACTLDTVWCAAVLCALTGKREDDEVVGGGGGGDPARRPSLWRGTSDVGKTGTVRSNLIPPYSSHSIHSSLSTSHLAVEGEGVAGWGSFGRIELGEGASVHGRRGSAAPEEMCLGAVNERKVVDGAWKAPSPQAEESEDEKEEEEGARLKVGFAVGVDRGQGR